MRKFLIYIFLSLTQLLPLAAQDIRVRAYVSKNVVGVDEQFEYSIEVSGKSTSLPDVQFPDLADFYVLSGPNSSTNMQWINGKMSASKTNSFYLQPRKEGRFTIAPARVRYKGKEYTSNSIVITVKKGAAVQNRKKTGQQPAARTDSELTGESLYLKTEVSKKRVYMGEQLLATYRLYFRPDVRTYNTIKKPANTGFWLEDFDLPPQAQIENVIVNGMNYRVATLRKIALFPTQTGTLTLDPMKITVETVVRARRRSRSLFDSFFDDPFGRTVQKSLSTKPVKITVLPLPEENKPADFGGAVGRFRMKVSTDKTTAKVNEAISLKISINGVGNIKLVDLPKIQIPPDLEQYAPKISTKINKSKNRISGLKTAEYILIPRIAGEYTLKPVRFSFFDPAAKSYKTVSSAPIHLSISGGGQSPAAVNASGGAGYSRQEVALLGKDIRFIKEYSVFTPIGYRPYLTTAYWLLISGGLLFFILFVLYNERKARLYSDVRLARRYKAGKIAAKQLARAKSLLGAEQSAFYKSVSLALQGFVQDKLNMELTDFSAPNIRRVFKERGIPEQEIDEYLAILQESDLGQFANISSAAEARQQVYDRAKSILTKLEKWI